MRWLAAPLVLAACSQAPSTAPAAASPPVPVKVEVMAPLPLDRALAGVGTVTALDTVELRAEIAGLVSQVLFTDGQAVSAGQPLVRLRDADARAAVLDADARATLAAAALDRARALAARGDLAQADLDRAQADDALARAAVARAREGLRRTTITAPFAGRMGRRDVSVGQLVDPSRVLGRLDALDPIAVDLVLPESAVGRLAVDQPAEVRLGSAEGGEPLAATVRYVAPRLREDTRTVDVRVTLPNPDGALRPGMSARVRIVTERVADALLVPTEAVVMSAKGPALYTVGADQVAKLAPVTLGERGERRVEVASGVAPGDLVVVEGLARMRPGATVAIQGDEPAKGEPGKAEPGKAAP